jgi:hypothetical protein
MTLGYDNTQIDYHNCSYCNYAFEHAEEGPSLSAAVAAPLHGDDGPWIIQGEGRLQTENDHEDCCGTSHVNAGHAAAHVAYRTDEYAIGAFYGIQNLSGDDIQEVGVEAQKYFSNMTLQGSVAYGKHSRDCSYCTEYNAWDAHADLTYYFNDSWSAGVGVGYGSFRDTYCSGCQTDTVKLTTIGVHAEYRIPDSNFSIRGAYTHGNGNGDRCAADYTTNTYQIAFVVDLGSGSARERDQHGASLQGADTFDTDWRLYEPACD